MKVKNYSSHFWLIFGQDDNLAWKNLIDDTLPLLLISPMWHFRALLHPSDVQVMFYGTKSAEEDTYFFGD